jgi:uncharacterized protein YdeI (BOF family)
MALVVTACGPGAPGVLSIQEARGREKGSAVTIEGYVTVPPGAFTSSAGEGFALQDSSAGIYVKVPQKLGFGLGTKVRVSGTLDEQAGLRTLQSEPASVEELRGTQQVAPRQVTTGSLGESVEGVLVRLSGKVTRTFQDDSPWGYKLFFDDGSGPVQLFIYVSSGFNKDTLSAIAQGQDITVTGMVVQYESIYQVSPRQPSDLVVQ